MRFKFNKGDEIKLLKHSLRYHNEYLVIGDKYILGTVGVKLAIVMHNNRSNIVELTHIKHYTNKLSKHLIL